MNYFKAYSTALHSKWHELILKWFFKTGIKRILIAFILLIAATVLSMHKLICDFLSDFNFHPGFSWIDYVTFFAKLIAIIIIILNGLAWAISEFKYNVVFLTQMTFVAIYFLFVYANEIWNLAFSPLALVLLSSATLIPRKQKLKKLRSRTISRSKKTTTPAASPEASITES